MATREKRPVAMDRDDGPILDPAWYDAIAVRRSRRRYDDRRVAPEARAALDAFCSSFRLSPGAHVELLEGDRDLFTGLLDRFGGYGRVEGAPLTAAFVAPEGAELEAGYVGEAFILEATRLGLDTCWVAGMFDREAAAAAVALDPGEHIVAVTPVGHAVDHKQFVERMMSIAVRSAARRQVEEIAPGLVRGTDGHSDPAGYAADDAIRSPGIGPVWPPWAVTAVEAARLAPSGANKQPWRFRLQTGALVLSCVPGAYWTAPIDLGIAMLHAELGAGREHVHGAWERLEAPDVARFVPD